MENPKPGHVREGVKETIDSVVVAFILAFVFRAFVVEAFVIPTGSMATTLYGKHGTITCQECGWEFAYGLADQSRAGGGVQRVGADSWAVCQNCGHGNTNLKINDEAGRRGNAEAGDRILVLKWPFDIGGQRWGPQRWDVTVFKDPGPGGQNFIKRLLGVPDEVLEIIDGDVYAVPTSNLSAEAMATLAARRRAKYLERAIPERRQHLNVLTGTHQQLQSMEEQLQVSQREAKRGEQALRRELDAKLRICRKTPAAQQALWTVVYDHDYPVRQASPRRTFWEPGSDAPSAWDTSERKIRCNSVGRDAGELRFSGKPINDMCAYNLNLIGRSDWNLVSDLDLEFVLVRRGGDGRIRLALSKYEDTFEAEIRADGAVALYRTRSGTAGAGTGPLCENRLDPLPIDQPIEVVFQNVDYRVSLRINGTEMLATTDERYAPRPAELRARDRQRRAPPSIWARDLDFEMWHVVLRRDLYYTNAPNQAVPGWGTEGNPIWLGPGQYFMLGDNSAASKDSRLWTDIGEHLKARGEQHQVGTVPRDQLIGRAFFVYWPSWHRSELLPFLRDWGWIPNVGRMRWIR